MKIYVNANFFIPALRGGNEIEIANSEVTLKVLLEELSSKDSDTVSFINRRTGEIDHYSYHITINDDDLEAVLQKSLQDGDRVTINLLGL